MDQKELREWEGRCTAEEPAPCRAGCPLEVDVRAFVQAVGQGQEKVARAILDKTLPCPDLVGRLCEGPCQAFCLRKDFGGSVAIAALEKFCITTVRSSARSLRMPARDKTVAVFGSGPSSLVLAFDLARKGFRVHVFQEEGRAGAWLRDLPADKLPPAILDGEIARLESLGVHFEVLQEDTRQGLEKLPVDAWYLGLDDRFVRSLGKEIGVFDPRTFALPQKGWFAGGHGEGPEPFIGSVLEGRQAAVSIDRFLQNASLTAERRFPRQGQTRLHVNTDFVTDVPCLPVPESGYGVAEAYKEAARCLDCQCRQCVERCVYLQEAGDYPKVHARKIFNNSAIVQGVRQANRFINSCSLCGQCAEICPEDFSMAELCLSARRQMVREKRMPPSAHWFALEEMRQAQGAEASLARHAPDQTESRVVFFPGCQLAGIRPQQTRRLYQALCAEEVQTGLWLHCCGAPAHWAGQEEEMATSLEGLQSTWKELGEPFLLLACSSCLSMFREHLPHIPVTSVWSFLAGLPAEKSTKVRYALSDPCTARSDAETRQAVRALVTARGGEIAPLPMSGALTECCGFGGLMDCANPGLARKVAEKRVAQSTAPFLTYCAMCREQLARTGKPVSHLLDILFPECALPAESPPAGISARRSGRRLLKNQCLRQLGEKERDPAPWAHIALLLCPEVVDLLEERRILEDDLRQVLHRAELCGQGFKHAEDGRHIVSATLGEVTFWVEYRPEPEGYAILRAWSHRMDILGGRL